MRIDRRTPARAPFAPPAWLTRRAVVFLALTYDAWLAMPWLLTSIGKREWHSTCESLLHVVLKLIVANSVARARDWRGAHAPVVLLACLAPLLSIVWDLPTSFRDNPSVWIAVHAFGFCTSLVTYLWIRFFVRRAFAYSPQPSHEETDRLARLAAAWMLAQNAFGFVVGFLLPLGRGRDLLDNAMLLRVVGVPLLILAIAAARIRMRRAWLARVARGDVAHWHIRIATENARPLPALAEGDGVLVYRDADEATGAYRDAPREELVGRVPRA